MPRFKFKSLIKRGKRGRHTPDETNSLSSSSNAIAEILPTSTTSSGKAAPSTESAHQVAVNHGIRETLGLRAIDGTSNGQNAIVDIILVHGLTGNSHGTWADPGTGVHWPSKLLPQDIPDARIFCFGYDADVTSFWGHASRNRLTEHAKSLMGDVVREREDTDTQSRKIIFITHSLGGLVVQKALSLSRSRSEAHLKQLERYTTGIVFLGTPHHGSDLAAWATVCGKLVKSFKDTNVDILNVLRPESEVLRDTQDEFGQLLESRKSEGRKINITCFYEELAMSIIGQVVPMSSASLLGYDSYGIHADHPGMARFPTNADMGYKRVIGEIKRWVRLARATAGPRTSAIITPVSTEAHEECLRSFFYQDMFFRRDTIPEAYPLTFEWIWYKENLGFRKWLRSGDGIFWISGKPGSGKSTLLKRIVSNPIRITRELNMASEESTGSINRPVIISHFFQYNIGPLVNSIEGFLRSLLWQILQEDASFSESILPMYSNMKRATGTVSWSKRELELGFRFLVHEFPQRLFYVFIDALDEYMGEDAEIANFLHTLDQETPTNVRFCVTSRPYPDFSFQFNGAQTIRIHDHTADDIRIFLRGRFREVIAKRGFFDLMMDTRERSDGVFLWVKLVCDELQRGWRQFDNAAQLQRRLKKMPKDLDSMYRRIFEDMERDDRDEACRMLAIAASAARPLTMIEFYYALVYSSAICEETGRSGKRVNIRSDVLEPVQMYLPDGLLFNHNILEDSPEYGRLKAVLEGRISAICRGILQVQHNRVRLLHETVETFFRGAVDWLVQDSFKLASLDGDDLLLRACILYQIALFECNPPLKWSTTSSDTSKLDGNTSINTVYINSVDYRQYHETNSWNYRGNVPLRLSFLFYAVDNWLDHAYKAEHGTQKGQNALMENLSGHSFYIWRRLFGIHNPERRRNLPLNILEIIIESKLNLTAAALLRSTAEGNHSNLSRELDDPESRNRLLFSVAKGGCPNVAKSIFALGVTFNGSTHNRSSLNGRQNAHTNSSQEALHRAIYFNHPSIIQLFIQQGADRRLEVDAETLGETNLPGLDENIGGTDMNKVCAEPLKKFNSHRSLQRSNARRNSFLRVTRDGKIWPCQPLEFAVLYDKMEAFFALLPFYSAEETSDSLQLALTAAAFKGRADYARVLLDHGADCNLAVQRKWGCFSLGTHTCYAILPAVYWGCIDIVELLISRGADVNIAAGCEAWGTLSSGTRKPHTDRPGTPVSVARDRLRLYPSKHVYSKMVSLLENSGASNLKVDCGIEAIVE